jgi:hypothetical protein
MRLRFWLCRRFGHKPSATGRYCLRCFVEIATSGGDS